MVTEQWFVSMESLAKRALTETKEGRVEIFTPKRWEKVYNHWLEAFQDWCVSRQIWWGHRIPAFYRQPSGEVMVTREDPSPEEARSSSKTKTCLTPGSARPCGRSAP